MTIKKKDSLKNKKPVNEYYSFNAMLVRNLVRIESSERGSGRGSERNKIKNKLKNDQKYI